LTFSKGNIAVSAMTQSLSRNLIAKDVTQNFKTCSFHRMRKHGFLKPVRVVARILQSPANGIA
jgi:hypothetical protein